MSGCGVCECGCCACMCVYVGEWKRESCTLLQSQYCCVYVERGWVGSVLGVVCEWVWFLCECGCSACMCVCWGVERSNCTLFAKSLLTCLCGVGGWGRGGGVLGVICEWVWFCCECGCCACRGVCLLESGEENVAHVCKMNIIVSMWKGSGSWGSWVR